jgi:hypothetical protein
LSDPNVASTFRCISLLLALISLLPQLTYASNASCDSQEGQIDRQLEIAYPLGGSAPLAGAKPDELCRLSAKPNTFDHDGHRPVARTTRGAAPVAREGACKATFKVLKEKTEKFKKNSKAICLELSKNCGDPNAGGRAYYQCALDKTRIALHGRAKSGTQEEILGQQKLLELLIEIKGEADRLQKEAASVGTKYVALLRDLTKARHDAGSPAKLLELGQRHQHLNIVASKVGASKISEAWARVSPIPFAPLGTTSPKKGPLIIEIETAMNAARKTTAFATTQIPDQQRLVQRLAQEEKLLTLRIAGANRADSRQPRPGPGAGQRAPEDPRAPQTSARGPGPGTGPGTGTGLAPDTRPSGGPDPMGALKQVMDQAAGLAKAGQGSAPSSGQPPAGPHPGQAVSAQLSPDSPGSATSLGRATRIEAVRLDQVTNIAGFGVGTFQSAPSGSDTTIKDTTANLRINGSATPPQTGATKAYAHAVESLLGEGGIVSTSEAKEGAGHSFAGATDSTSSETAKTTSKEKNGPYLGMDDATFASLKERVAAAETKFTELYGGGGLVSKIGSFFGSTPIQEGPPSASGGASRRPASLSASSDSSSIQPMPPRVTPIADAPTVNMTADMHESQSKSADPSQPAVQSYSQISLQPDFVPNSMNETLFKRVRNSLIRVQARQWKSLTRNHRVEQGSLASRE